MSGSDPLDLIDGLTTTDDVSKSETRAELLAVTRSFPTAANVALYDLSGRSVIYIDEYRRFFRKDTSDTTTATSSSLVRDINGLAFAQIDTGGLLASNNIWTGSNKFGDYTISGRTIAVDGANVFYRPPIAIDAGSSMFVGDGGPLLTNPGGDGVTGPNPFAGRYIVGVGLACLPKVVDASYLAIVGFEGFYWCRNSTRGTGIGEAVGFYIQDAVDVTLSGWKAGHGHPTTGAGAVPDGLTATGSSATFYIQNAAIDTAAYGAYALNGDPTAGMTGPYNAGFGRNAAAAMRAGHRNLVLAPYAAPNLRDGPYNTIAGFGTANGLIDGGGNLILGASINCGEINDTILLAAGSSGTVRYKSDSLGHTYLGDGSTAKKVYLYYAASTNNAGLTTNSSGDMSAFTGTSSPATRQTWFGDGGVMVGAATGGSKGAGTLNAAAFYIQGNQLQISGAASLPAIAQGDLWYGSASGVVSALAKDTGTSRFLKNSGTSNNPAWARPAASDLSDGVSGTGAIALASGATLTSATLVTPLIGAGTLSSYLDKGIFILDGSAIAASITGTTAETTLATVTVGANVPGTKGILRITTQWSFTGAGGTRTTRTKFGGVTFQQLAATTAGLSARNQTAIQNRGIANSQVGTSVDQVNFGQANSTTIFASVDTTASSTILITAQLANAGDSATLESYLVELIRP